MARIHIPDEARDITAPAAIAAFLERFGIWYEQWAVDGRVGAEATGEEILAAFAAEVDRLKARGAFVTADVINVNPATPNLEALLARFASEHTHDEDEVRFTVHGRGVFHIHPDGAPVFAIYVEPGDLINVPRGTRHWFDLCADRTIRCIRLFQDVSGWTPHYVADGVHAGYAPLCLGRGDVAAEPTIPPILTV
jgi:1,2-dihydroxy-3-keto-5-methylthiopentene dioxygenase